MAGINILLSVTVTDTDVSDAFKEIYGREPSAKELEKCLDNVHSDTLEEYLIDKAYDDIKERIREVMK